MGFCWRHNSVEKDFFEEEEEDKAFDPQANEKDVMLGDEDSQPNRENPPLPNGHSNHTSGKLPAITELKVNNWQPPEDERETPQYISRLETALVYRSRVNNGYTGALGAVHGGFDEDDPMWTAGIVAEEAVRGGIGNRDLLEPTAGTGMPWPHLLDNTHSVDGSLQGLTRRDSSEEEGVDGEGAGADADKQAEPAARIGKNKKGFSEVKATETTQTSLFLAGPGKLWG